MGKSRVLAMGASLTLALVLLAAGTSAAPAKRELQREDTRGSVTVRVTYLNPLGKAKGDTLDFEVRMNTHSVDLDGYKVEALAVLHGPGGIKVDPLGWFEPGGGGHHRFGILRFPKKDREGRSLLRGGGKLELRIRGIGAAAERTFVWNLSR